MNTMTKYDLEPIVKTFYDALEEGTVLEMCIRDSRIRYQRHETERRCHYIPVTN